MTVAAQTWQAARYLGLEADDWRIREAWYGRAGGWSASGFDDLRRRAAAHREQHPPAPPTLAQRLAAVRRLLAEFGREVDARAADLTEGAP